MNVKTRDELYNWILLRLGHPVLNQELYDDHIQACIDDAIEYFMTRTAYGSSTNTTLIFTVTDPNNIILPSYISNILGVISHVDSNNYLFNPFVQELATWSIAGFMNNMVYDLVTSYMYNQRLALLDTVFIKKYNWDFNQITKQLILNPQVKQNQQIVIDVYHRVSVEEPGLLNHPWIKRYALALCKRMWGEINSKYSGKVIAGNIEVAGETMFQRAQEEITKLEEELFNVWCEPPLFFMG